MVSFQCDGCADTVKKPKLDQHRQRCWASFTCLDCSTTFRDQEYKGHTSCVSEAEKYQGALYKGPKKNQGKPYQQNNFTSAPNPPLPSSTPATSTPGSPASASASASTSAIHPSRLAIIDNGESNNYSQSQNGFAGRGGRGRGGFARGGGAVGGGRGGFGPRGGITGENSRVIAGGMRSWGSPAVSENVPEVQAPTVPSTAPVTSAASQLIANGVNGAEKSKSQKRKKGDKGGTGSKANTKRPKEDGNATTKPAETTTAPEIVPTPQTNGGTGSEKPKEKKRKREASPQAATTLLVSSAPAAEAAPSEKTLKRIKKNLGKIDASTGSGLSLAQWLEKVGKSKKDGNIESKEVMQGLKVSQVDGKWVLSV